MNPTRRRMLTFIRDFETEFGCTPSVKEIAAGLSLTVETTTRNLQMLQSLGYMRLEKNEPHNALQIVKYRLPGEAAVMAKEG